MWILTKFILNYSDFSKANGHELVGHLGRISRGGDAFGILNNMAPPVPAMRLVNTVTASTVDTADDDDTGEDDHDEELYTKSRPHGQLVNVRGTTKGYEHLRLRHGGHETAGVGAGAGGHAYALPVPITYRNEAELPSTLHICATLPESLPLSPPHSSARSSAQSSAEPFMMLRECTQCQKETKEENGKVDENDGDWYCNDCWTFYE